MATLQAKRRDKAIKPSALRRQGILPLALTRRDHQTIELQAPLDNVRQAMRQADGHGRFELEIEGEGRMRVILKQQAIDYIHQRPLHASFMEVSDEDVVKMDVAVLGRGTPEPVDAGEGMLVQPTDHVKLRGRMADLPEHLEVDVSGMQIGQSISAHELQLPPGVELLSAPDAILFTLQVAKDQMLETAPEEVAEEEQGEEGGESSESEE